MAKNKFRKGDIVKFVEGFDEYDIYTGEIGFVEFVYDPDGAAAGILSVSVLDDSLQFAASIQVDVTKVKKIGSRIKWKKVEKLWKGDIILVDGPQVEKLGLVTTVAKKIKSFEYDEDNLVLTIYGKDFSIEVPADEFEEKVPVVV